MWFDILVLVTFFSVLGEEIARGGKAISPTRLVWLIAVGLFSFAVPIILDRFGIPHTTLASILVLLVIVNVAFIVPAIIAQAVIASFVSGFLLALVVEYLPSFTPHGSQLYPMFRPIAHQGYVLTKPFVDKYIALLKSKIAGINNIDPSKVKPTLPGKGSGGSVKPTLP